MELVESYKKKNSDKVFQIYKKGNRLIKVIHIYRDSDIYSHIYEMNSKDDRQELCQSDVEIIIHNLIYKKNGDFRYNNIRKIMFFHKNANNIITDNIKKSLSGYLINNVSIYFLDSYKNDIETNWRLFSNEEDFDEEIQIDYYLNNKENDNYQQFLVDNKLHENYATDAISWPQYFMAIALLASMRSKDPNTKVGACLVDKHNRILSSGYNGAPRGMHDDYFPWARFNRGAIETKYNYVVHSEENAILNYPGPQSDLEDATLYVTLFPCPNCAKTIAQKGIKKIIFLDDKYKGTADDISSKKILDFASVEYEKFSDGNLSNMLRRLKENIISTQQLFSDRIEISDDEKGYQITLGSKDNKKVNN